MSKALRMMWAVELKFHTPVHIGKGSTDAYMGAAEVVQNGAGEYVLPGTTLAGLFFSRMSVSASIQENQKLYNSIHLQDGSKAEEASPLVFRTAVLSPKGDYLRDRVRINRETKTADDKAKFSQWEVHPHNATILIELDNVTKADNALSEGDVSTLMGWINQVLASWQQEGLYIGAHSSVGNGFTKVNKAWICTLNKDNYQTYLATPSTDPDLVTKMGGTELSLASIKYRAAFTRRYQISVKTGLHDPLLIKGNDYYPSADNPATDSPFINRDGKVFIPGSSLRGAICSFMEKYQVNGWSILAGSTDKAGRIMFNDLYLQDSEPKPELVQIERHAEDQLSRAIYGTGKFDEERIFNAVFRGQVLVENTQILSSEELDHIFSFLKDGMKFRLIALGSGAAHPEITLEEVK
jgi:CRISPR/Cas system CSM-associated protein Csm3 (group 7 of RAMP superfamily)